ncbi:hypothetical protein PTKIN_Ptkin13bG0218200 [Pterospermum kingtungense]
MFMAGTETSSITVKWVIGELINHPQSFKKLRQEINSVVRGDRLVKESDVQNLPYLQAVVKETLRLHPSSVLLLRQGNEDCKINGFYLKPKKRFMGNTNLNANKELLEMKGQKFDYLPFGSGRHVCPGASLALVMVHSTVAALVQ